MAVSRWVLGLAGLAVACGALAGLWGEGAVPVAAGVRERLMEAGWSGPGVLEWRAQEATGARAGEIYRELLRRDAANPYRWCDWGEALQGAGDLAGARRAIGEAVELGAGIAPVQVRAGNFYFGSGDAAGATAAYRRVLGLTHEYDPIVFLTLRRLGLEAGEITGKVLPRDAETGRNYLAFVMQNGGVGESKAVWDWLVGSGFGSDRLGAEYVDFLLKKGQGGMAAAAWAELAGKRRGDYLAGNYVYNGGFREAVSGNRLDWHVEAVEGAETELGGGELRIQFEGKANVAYHGVWQDVWAPAGRYRIRAHVKATGVTTNQGVQVHLADPVGHRVEWVSEAVLGTRDWYWVEGNVVVPECPYLRLEMVRQPSEKFDNKISGTVEFGSISLVRGQGQPNTEGRPLMSFMGTLPPGAGVKGAGMVSRKLYGPEAELR